MSSKQYNKLYPNRGCHYLTYCSVYYKDKETIITEHKVSLFGKVVLLLFLPFLILFSIVLEGVNSLKGGIGEYIKIITIPLDVDATYPRHTKSWKILSEFIDKGVLPK